MKFLFITLLFLSSLNAGFFNDASASDKQELLENKRLCELFTQKAEEYKKHMRNDLLAKTTLASYKHRASLFCGKAKAAESNTSE
jgi:hypothetical protein